jgi:hypothetical protein
MLEMLEPVPNEGTAPAKLADPDDFGLDPDPNFENVRIRILT